MDKRGVARVDFPLVLLGKIRGRVLVVQQRPDGSGRPATTVGDPEPERPAAGILVQLDNARTTMTDVDGEFEFSGVVRGDHAVRVVAASLPASWRPAAEPTVIFSLEPGKRVDGVRLVIVDGSPAIRKVTFE